MPQQIETCQTIDTAMSKAFLLADILDFAHLCIDLRTAGHKATRQLCQELQQGFVDTRPGVCGSPLGLKGLRR